MKYTHSPDQFRTESINYINQRWSQLNLLSKDVSDRAIKYLMLTNSGGAIAMLSFLGASETVRSLLAPKIALGFFSLGIILVGVLNATILHHVDWLFSSWRTDVKKYMEDKIDWETMTDADDKRSYATTLHYIVGYGAFASFITGSAIALRSLLSQ